MEDTQIITLGGGCFWCVEALLQQIKGVEKVISGYANGLVDNPTYKMVCTGESGYAEVVQVYYQPSVIGLSDLLMIFMTSHDPTTLNRQGADRGTQYRSIIASEREEDLEVARSVIAKLSSYYANPIVTQVEALRNFYAAEAYHQNYYNRNKDRYCQIVIDPKLSKLRSQYLTFLK